MMRKVLAYLICIYLMVAFPAVSVAQTQDGVDVYTFLYRYASWNALLFPETKVIPPILVSDMDGTITAGAVTIGYNDDAARLVVTVSCEMSRKDEALINQMVAIVAALSDDEAAALTFTEEQAAVWVDVCTQAVQSSKEAPYRLGAYELYILSSDDEVHLYAILGGR